MVRLLSHRGGNRAECGNGLLTIATILIFSALRAYNRSYVKVALGGYRAIHLSANVTINRLRQSVTSVAMLRCWEGWANARGDHAFTKRVFDVSRHSSFVIVSDCDLTLLAQGWHTI